MDVISPTGPLVCFHLHGLTNPALDSKLLNISQRNTQDTPLWPAYFSQAVDVGQSIREDSNYACSHGLRNGLLRSLITTLNLHEFNHVAMLTLGNAPHVIHPMR